MGLVYDVLSEHLKERFPASERPRYKQMIGGIEAGPYVVFGVIFNQYLVDQTAEPKDEERNRVAAFLEEMATPPIDGSPIYSELRSCLHYLEARRRSTPIGQDWVWQRAKS